jgi:hypothetical protein
VDATRILSRLRQLECDILVGYKELAEQNEICASAMLNVSFDLVRALKGTPGTLKQNLNNTFDANRSTIFTLCEDVFQFSDTDDFKVVEFDDLKVRQIRALERKVVLELRELCISAPVVAKVCSGLNDRQIVCLAGASVSDVIEYCYRSPVSVLKLRFQKEKGFTDLLKLVSKPTFRSFGLLMDRIAC